MDTYSRIILSIKTLLPTISILLIIATAMIANKNHITKFRNLAEIAEQYELNVTSHPISIGQTESGMNYVMEAEASQNHNASDDYDRIFEVFQLELTEIRKITTNINSDLMYYNSVKNVADLVGNVFAHNSIGQNIRTDRMIIDFSSQMAQTSGAVQIQNSNLTLHAGKMTVEDFGMPKESLFFTSGVRATYSPQNLSN